jgi:hypothetical protein
VQYFFAALIEYRIMKMKPLNYWYFIILVSCLFEFCKKSHIIDPSVAGYKIKAVYGQAQADTIGNILKDSIVFRATYNGDPLHYGYVRLETYDCDSVLQITDIDISLPIPPLYLSEITFKWQLNSTIGTQYLKAILLDSAKRPQDSVTITATGIVPGKGWHASGCLAINTCCTSFAEMPSGRIYTALAKSDYPYYSDDGAVNWHRLKNFPAQYHILKIISTPLNEVFLYAAEKGVFYSGDGGQSWQERDNGLTSPSDFSGNIYYTTSGQLFLVITNGIYVSHDKGLNWTGVNFLGAAGTGGFWDAYSTSDTTVYAIDAFNLIKSNDKGNTFMQVFNVGLRLEMLFIDSSNNFFFSSNNNLYESKDFAQTWNLIYVAPQVPYFNSWVTQMTFQNNAYYFYATGENILTTSSDLTNFTSIYPPVYINNSRWSSNYILSMGNRFILSVDYYGLYYFIP